MIDPFNTLPLTDTSNPSDPYDRRRGVANGSLNANLYRQYPGFSTITQEENETNFSYNALQTQIRMEAKHGLTVQLAYTLSHEIDEVSTDLSGVGNPFNKDYNRGSGSLDRRHDFNANYIYNLPFFLQSANGPARSTLGGWSVSGVTVIDTGIPQLITYNGADVLGLGGGTTNRPYLTGNVSYPRTRTAWFDKSVFSSPVAPWLGGGNNGFGDTGKDKVRLPGRLNFNLSLFKSIVFKPEGLTLQLRFETFNTFNHTQFSALDAASTDPNFGAVTAAYDPRRLQLGAKLTF